MALSQPLNESECRCGWVANGFRNSKLEWLAYIIYGYIYSGVCSKTNNSKTDIVNSLPSIKTGEFNSMSKNLIHRIVAPPA